MSEVCSPEQTPLGVSHWGLGDWKEPSPSAAVGRVKQEREKGSECELGVSSPGLGCCLVLLDSKQ